MLYPQEVQMPENFKVEKRKTKQELVKLGVEDGGHSQGDLSKNCILGTSQVVRGKIPHSGEGAPGPDPGQGTRFHMPATTKTPQVSAEVRAGEINKYF